MADSRSVNTNSSFLLKKKKLVQLLEEGVLSGAYCVGGRIPSERALGQLLELSRPAVHQSLLELEKEGIIRWEGRKIFLADKALPTAGDGGLSGEPRRVIVITRSDCCRNLVYLEIFEAFTKHLPESIQCEMRFYDDMADFMAHPPPDDAVLVILARWLPDPLSGDFGRNTIFINDWRANANCISPDNYGGGCQIAEHLWRLGHRKIAVSLLSQCGENAQEYIDRYQGIVDRFTEAGGEVSALGAGPQFSLEESCKQLFGRFLQHRDITALVALRDEIAIQLLGCARQNNLTIPDDFSLARFDDNFYASYVSPSLTSSRFPAQEIAALLAESVVQAFRLPPHEVFIRKKVMPLLLERRSTAQVGK